jgi:hypothetical protein
MGKRLTVALWWLHAALWDVDRRASLRAGRWYVRAYRRWWA